MNFDDTPQEAAFRAEAKAWIAANAPKQYEDELQKSSLGRTAAQGRQHPRGRESLAEEEGRRRLGLPALAEGIWRPRRDADRARDLAAGRGRVRQAQRHVHHRPRHVRADHDGLCRRRAEAAAICRRWPPAKRSGASCSPSPPADPTSPGLRTRAEKQGDDWIINGQKIWTSGAHYSDYGILLTRTDPNVPKHKGLTMFFLDMKSRRASRSSRSSRPTAQSDFNEVYFTDVKIPDAQRLGEVNDGWNVSLTTLMNERMSIGAGVSTGFPELFEFCSNLMLEDGLAIDDRGVRSKLANWAVKASGLKYTSMRAISALSKGERPGPENSIGKLVAGSMIQDVAAYALDLQGAAGVLSGPEDAEAAGKFQAMLLRAPGTRVEGGTDEIMRNIIAERVLGLPGDIRVDKDVPFNKIPTKGRA